MTQVSKQSKILFSFSLINWEILGTNNTLGRKVRGTFIKDNFVLCTQTVLNAHTGFAVQVPQSTPKNGQILYRVHIIYLKTKIFKNNCSMD